LEEPLDAKELPENELCGEIDDASRARAKAFVAEFDGRMKRPFSTLADWSGNAEAVLADAVREVVGRTSGEMTDSEAIGLALDPAKNPVLGESLNLTTHSKIIRSLFHAHYTFRKRISHTADSQDQRHRMTPGSRPALTAHLSGDPDYIVPRLVLADSAVERAYRESMERTWEDMVAVRHAGAPAEFAEYLLPNAVSVRFTESADLLNLWHKHAMRLCYNAQEEIWQASVEEAAQIREVDPRIGRHLLPPCSIRHRAGQRPVCPEGTRFCGERVWTLEPAAWERRI
jgi:hypothetical protein